MANGDAAAAAFGWVPVLPTDDIRLGYDRINALADALAANAFAAWGPLYSTTAACTAAGFTGVGSWVLNSLQVVKRAKRVSMTGNISRVAGSGAVTIPSNGDLGNGGLFSLPASLTPAASNGVMNPGGTGPLIGGYASVTNQVILSAVAPNTVISGGFAMDFLLVYDL